MNAPRNPCRPRAQNYGPGPETAASGSPLLLEVDVRAWLHECSAGRGGPVALGSAPADAAVAWRRMGVTHVWLMGVWPTGPLSRERALTHPGLRREFDRILPRWQAEDVGGSPYAIAGYRVPAERGGRDGLLEFRERLHRHGLKLVLDFIPNHVGLDHPWIDERPDYFVPCPAGHPHGFRRATRRGERWMAHGRDPHFPPWDDTVQLDYRRADVHRAVQEELLQVADLCDGVRCDMAMLLLGEVFERTWEGFPMGGNPGERAGCEFWPEAIRRVRAVHPAFLFLAEVYWNLEERLQQLGFDYTYDKRLTDAVLRRETEDVTRHLRQQPPGVLRRSAHFLENHDEPRVASELSLAEHRPAAALILALPGMRFLQDGQVSGATIRTPVQLRRRPEEPNDPAVTELYAGLLAVMKDAHVGVGEGRVLRTRAAWENNATWQTVVAIQWGGPGGHLSLVVVNLGDHSSQCRAPLEGVPAGGGSWQLVDLLGPERWIRDNNELRDPGLFLDVAPRAVQVFILRPASA